MHCEEVKINLPEFIDGKLDKTYASKIKEHIQSCSSCTKIHEELRSFLKFTDSIPEIEPPEGMKEEFMVLAGNEEIKGKTRVMFPDWLKVAAVILIAIGIFSGGYFSGSGNKNTELLVAEVKELKQQVLLAGLQDYSGPQKIEAVYSVANVETTSNELIDALVYTLNSDKNVNVRLAALTVLSGMLNGNEQVKTELIKSLGIQDNPLIQISLIQTLTQNGVKEAKEDIEHLSIQKDTDPSVKDFAENMVKTII